MNVWDAVNRQTKVISRAKSKGLNANVLSRAYMMAACVNQDHDYQAFLCMRIPVE
jgi:hypothetical protein